MREEQTVNKYNSQSERRELNSGLRIRSEEQGENEVKKRETVLEKVFSICKNKRGRERKKEKERTQAPP